MTWTIRKTDKKVVVLPLAIAKAEEPDRMFALWETQEGAQQWADTLNQILGGNR